MIPPSSAADTVAPETAGPRRTVLIFAHECAPHHRTESTAGAQRPAQFAKYLPGFGWRAIVLCCDGRQRRRARASDLGGILANVRQALRDDDGASSVIVPIPSLESDGLLDRWWFTVEGSAGARRAPRAWLRKTLTVAKIGRGDYSRSWQPVARRAAEAVAEAGRVDACIGEHSPDAGLFLARWFSARYGVPWLADFRDPMLWPLRPVLSRLYAPIARRLVRTAACTINVNPVWAAADRSFFGLPSHCIPNGFDPEEFSTPIEAPGNSRLTVVYAGSIPVFQRIAIFLEGLALARDEEVSGRQLVFVYRGAQFAQVRELSASCGIAAFVDAAPAMERSEALALMRRADLLLLLSVDPTRAEDSLLSRGLYPAKTFEYFGARRPILCVPGDHGILDQLIEETATGTVLCTPQEIAEYLVDAFACWRDQGALPYQPNEQAISRFTRRHLAGELAALLDATIGRDALPVRTDAHPGRR